MNRSKLINDIVNRIELNRYYMTAVVTNDTVRKEFERNNKLLEEIKSELYLEKMNEQSDMSHISQYEKGVKDAWNLAFKISGSPDKCCYNNDELYEIFDCRSSCGVFDSYSYNTALRLVEEYEKKKEEEAKLVPGDVVEFESIRYGKIKGIFIKYEDWDMIILSRKGGSYRLVGKDVWNIEKTGEHVDISGLIGVLYE